MLEALYDKTCLPKCSENWLEMHIEYLNVSVAQKLTEFWFFLLRHCLSPTTYHLSLFSQLFSLILTTMFGLFFLDLSGSTQLYASDLGSLWGYSVVTLRVAWRSLWEYPGVNLGEHWRSLLVYSRTTFGVPWGSNRWYPRGLLGGTLRVTLGLPWGSTLGYSWITGGVLFGLLVSILGVLWGQFWSTPGPLWGTLGTLLGYSEDTLRVLWWYF